MLLTLPLSYLCIDVKVDDVDDLVKGWDSQEQDTIRNRPDLKRDPKRLAEMGGLDSRCTIFLFFANQV